MPLTKLKKSEKSAKGFDLRPADCSSRLNVVPLHRNYENVRIWQKEWLTWLQ